MKYLILILVLFGSSANADNNWIFKTNLPDEVVKLEVSSEMEYCENVWSHVSKHPHQTMFWWEKREVLSEFSEEQKVTVKRMLLAERRASCFEVGLERVLIYHSSISEKERIFMESARKARKLREEAERESEKQLSNEQ